MSNLSYYLMAFFWLPCWSGSSSLERHSVHGGFRASLAKAIPEPIGLCWLCRASSSSPFSRPERLGTFGSPAALPLSFAYETSNQALERVMMREWLCAASARNHCAPAALIRPLRAATQLHR